MTPLDRRVPLTTVLNARDLGGLPVSGGVFAAGQVFRSGALGELSSADAEVLGARGIATVYDLRTAGEEAAAPDRVPAGAESILLDVLADSPETGAANVGEMLKDPVRLAEALGDGQGAEMLRSSYRHIVSLPSARTAYAAFFRGLADDSRGGAALFHCTAGKDRTGWAAAALLTLLGASSETIHDDYLQTNTDFVPALQPVLDKIESAGIDPNLVLPVVRVEADYLDAAFNEAESRFGSMAGYFEAGLGLDASVVEALRARFVA